MQEPDSAIGYVTLADGWMRDAYRRKAAKEKIEPAVQLLEQALARQVKDALLTLTCLRGWRMPPHYSPERPGRAPFSLPPEFNSDALPQGAAMPRAGFPRLFHRRAAGPIS